MALIAVVGVMTIGAAVLYIGGRVPPEELLMVARATGSLRACLGYLLFCLRH